MEIILAQIVVVIINSYIAITENKKNIYLVTFLFNFANLIMYIVNKDKTTAILYIVITVRAFVYMYKDKYNYVIIPIIAILAQLIVGFSSIDNIIQLIPILTPCWVCYYMWFCKTTQQLRVNNAVCNFAWFVYNLVGGLYIVAISRIITVIVNIIEYNKHRENKVQ